MQTPLNLPMRQKIVAQKEQGLSLSEIARQEGLSYHTVFNIWNRYLQRGISGLAPDYSRCGAAARDRIKPLMRRASLWLKRLHPRWGAPFIRLKMQERYGAQDLPSVRIMQQWFRETGLNAPRQRNPKPPAGSSSNGVFHIVQIDAKEQLRLRDGQGFCYLTVVDEYSGAWLEAPVFPLCPYQPGARSVGERFYDKVFCQMGQDQSSSSGQRRTIWFPGTQHCHCPGALVDKLWCHCHLERPTYSATKRQGGTDARCVLSMVGSRLVRLASTGASPLRPSRPNSEGGVSGHPLKQANPVGHFPPTPHPASLLGR